MSTDNTDQKKPAADKRRKRGSDKKRSESSRRRAADKRRKHGSEKKTTESRIRVAADKRRKRRSEKRTEVRQNPICPLNSFLSSV
jgi:hypothetical protein